MLISLLVKIAIIQMDYGYFIAWNFPEGRLIEESADYI